MVIFFNSLSIKFRIFHKKAPLKQFHLYFLAYSATSLINHYKKSVFIKQMNFYTRILLFLFNYQLIKQLKHFAENGWHIEHFVKQNNQTQIIKKESKCLNTLETKSIITKIYSYCKHTLHRVLLPFILGLEIHVM